MNLRNTDIGVWLSKMAQPINFEELARQGVISKAGAWYRLHKPPDLPEHAALKVQEIAQDAKGIKVKFARAGIEEAARKLASDGEFVAVLRRLQERRNKDEI